MKRLTLAVAVALFGAQALAYVLPARSVLKRFADKQAVDRVEGGPLTGRATLQTERGAERLRVNAVVGFPGQCSFELELAEGEARAALQDGRVQSDGEVPALDALVALGCPLVTMKRVPSSDAEASLSRLADSLGVNLNVVSLRQLSGRASWVLGARPRDETSPQVWFDKETQRPVRVVASHAGRLWDVRYSDVRSLATARRHPRIAEVWQDGRQQLLLSLRAGVNEQVEAEASEADEADDASE